MAPLDFWFSHVGEQLGGRDPVHSTGLPLPMRTNTGIKLLRVGSVGPVYFCIQPEKAILVSRIELEVPGNLTLLRAEDYNPDLFVAHWLLNAKPPYMVGKIEKAAIAPALQITTHRRATLFCESSGNTSVDMERVKRAYELFKPYDWKETAVCLHTLDKYQAGDDMARQKLLKAFEKMPGLANAITNANIRPNSGEYTLLSWLNRSPKSTEIEDAKRYSL